MIDLDDLVLAIASAGGGRVDGRTKLQKLGYFVSCLMPMDAGYRPHYYGPYSPDIAATAQSQVSRGLLAERCEVYDDPRFPGHDGEWRRYVYCLTSAGRQALEWRRSQAPDDFDRAQTLAARLLRTNADYTLLSYAAKLYMILLQESRALTLREALDRAHQLGWSMSEQDMQKGAGLLAQLELVKDE